VRVLYLVNVPRARLTGAARRFLALARAARASGSEITLVAPPGSAIERAAAQEGFPFHRATFRPRPRDVGDLRRIVRDAAPDVVHAASIFPLALAVPRALLRRPPGARPALFASVLVDPASDMVFAGGPRPLAKRLRNGIARRVAPRLDALFPVSRIVAESLASLGIRGRTIVSGAVIDIGDLERRASAPVELPAGRPLIGSAIGQLEPLKGARFLVTAFASLAAAYPQAALLVAGEGSERSALEALAGQLGVGARVHFVGYLEDPAPVVARLDLYVSPSLSEGLGQAIAEAMALGVPVVATDVGGVRELVAEDRGLLVPPADADALAAAMRRTLDDPALAAAMAERAKAFVETTYGRGAAIDAVWAEYLRATARQAAES